MKTYTLTLRAQTPVCLGLSDSGQNHISTERIISGQTLRGAFAALWWRNEAARHADPGGHFSRLFDANLYVSQAVPTAGIEGTTPRLNPTTLRTCKYRQGAECADYRDDLAERELDGGRAASACPHCNGPLSASPGWAGLPVPVPRTRAALDGNEIPIESKLFTKEYLPKGTTFVGAIRAPERPDWLDGAMIRVGASKSTGPGKLAVTIGEDVSVQPWLPGTRHLLVAMSPVILTDRFGGPALSREALRDELRVVSGDEALEVYAEPGWLRTQQVLGFHSRSATPRQPDWALAPGSSFIVDGLSSSGWMGLQAGIGWRTIDGFGQLRLVKANVTEGSDLS